VQKQPGFVYRKAQFVQPKKGPEVLEIQLEPDARTHPTCSGCGEKGPGYDTLRPRRFEFVPLWGLAVFFLYAMRRVDCGSCGVTVERVPWAEGKSPLTKAYMWFLASWAKRMSWKEVAEAFRCSWEKVFLSVEKAVE
jgi:transposase